MRAAGTANPTVQVAGSRAATSFRVNPDRATADTGIPAPGRWTGVPVGDGTRAAGSRHRAVADAATVGPVLPRRTPPVVQRMQDRAAAREPQIITRRTAPDAGALVGQEHIDPDDPDVAGILAMMASKSADPEQEPAQT